MLSLNRLAQNLHSKLSRKLTTNYKNLRILGIETSCDDTGCAVVDGSGQILSETLFSQNLVHLRNGGINPLIAYELHRDNIDKVVDQTLQNSSLKLKDIDALAVTVEPGLLISLQVGVKYANFIARNHNKPIIPIHHMKAHALAARMYEDIPYPFLVLLISGGHCLLAVANDVDDFLLLGKSLDDAPGEAFDKVARRMKLRNIPAFSKLPGGKAIELAAQEGIDLSLFEFPMPLVKIRDCNFSFSGIKESLYRKLRRKEVEHKIFGDEIIPEVSNLCASFQLAVAEHLVHRTQRAAEFCLKRKLIPVDRKNLVISGGVACNNFIFKSLLYLGNKIGFKVHRPPPLVCTDNGIMIAWNGIEKCKKQFKFSSYFDPNLIQPKAPIGKDIINDVKECNIQVKVTRLKNLIS